MLFPSRQLAQCMDGTDPSNAYIQYVCIDVCMYVCILICEVWEFCSKKVLQLLHLTGQLACNDTSLGRSIMVLVLFSWHLYCLGCAFCVCMHLFHFFDQFFGILLQGR